ncbi:hypothetical protein JTE90_000070 [Oedothorax gibbosus]|uniref:Transmembrane protein n=1 Tax=Oedothorax gibbosus TaxID=931172 RepID=A0AAV6UEZ3_9ARAC|nr:hypothetical protein JTE90_000070 [Oedothorax gibbosus]
MIPPHQLANSPRQQKSNIQPKKNHGKKSNIEKNPAAEDHGSNDVKSSVSRKEAHTSRYTMFVIITIIPTLFNFYPHYTDDLYNRNPTPHPHTHVNHIIALTSTFPHTKKSPTPTFDTVTPTGSLAYLQQPPLQPFQLTQPLNSSQFLLFLSWPSFCGKRARIANEAITGPLEEGGSPTQPGPLGFFLSSN